MRVLGADLAASEARHSNASGLGNLCDLALVGVECVHLLVERNLLEERGKAPLNERACVVTGGGVPLEENVVAAAGVSFRLSRTEIHTIIDRAGFVPKQRYMDYRLVEPEQGVPA